MTRTTFLLACAVLLGCCSTPTILQTTSQPASVDDRRLVLGHQKFMEGCAKCHDERGDKMLDDGSVLSEMEFTESVLAEKVGHRAHGFTPEEQAAILLYVRSLLIHQPTIASTP